MPVRSSNSSVLRWPDREAVHRALASWARREGSEDPILLRVGYFGSYARGDWGVGSDLDVVLVVADSEEPFHARGSSWNLNSLPVPAQALVYSREEWSEVLEEDSRFGRMLRDETVWVYER